MPGPSATTDTCNPATGCVFINNSELCDDDNVCTDDWCDPIEGCRFLDNSDPCDDGDACTSNDRCINGSCHGEQTFGLDKWRQFTECYDGVAVEVEVGCQCSDLDDDGDVDLLDVDEFMRRFDDR